MELKCKNDFFNIGWKLELNDTLKGLVSFGLSVGSQRPFFSLEAGVQDLSKVLSLLANNKQELIENGYVGDDFKYLEECIGFFKELADVTQEFKISDMPPYFITIPEGGNKPQFCMRFAEKSQNNNTHSCKFVKVDNKIRAYYYNNDLVTNESLYDSCEAWIYSLFGH